ncbi:hypothetical protein DYU11_13200 [Fibrisoma montanum]|uniref:Uncharacterized protein n=1 Tax=Fibrisoma montanum TaxID=2305895 RepID=A0A418MC17_9BACT|nr:hypothetical protein DYU11_13200 [Fibrisoma montanum]
MPEKVSTHGVGETAGFIRQSSAGNEDADCGGVHNPSITPIDRSARLASGLADKIPLVRRGYGERRALSADKQATT